MNQTIDREAIKKIVVLRLDKVGDLILSTPFFKNLREGFPQAHIAVVVTPYTEEVMKGDPAVDEVLVYDGDSPLRDQYDFLKKLGSQNWDLAIALSPVSMAYLFTYFTHAPLRYGYAYSRRVLSRFIARVLLTHVKIFSIDEALKRHEKIPHEVEQMLSLLQDMGMETKDYGLSISIHDDELVAAKATLGEWIVGKRLIGVHLSWKWLTDSWTAEDFCEFARALLARYKESYLLLTYGPLEYDLASSISGLLKGEDRILLQGNLSFKRWAGLIAQCDVFFSPDTGALHCATALGIPVIGVYESRSFEHCSQQWAPWKIPHVIVKKRNPEETITELLIGGEKLINTGRMS